MSKQDRGAAPSAASAPSFYEFVALVALMMGTTAFSIDNLLPAFEPIRQDLGVTRPGDLQLIVTAFMLGFALMQLVFGTISDVIGRKPALMMGLIIYCVGTVLALVTDNYTVLLIARVIQGMGAAASRVLSVAIVRDRFKGRDMARVMSLCMMVFLVVPVVAPAIGSGILMIGTWHHIFVAMLALTVVLAVWFGARMPETLHPEYRQRFSLGNIARGMRLTVTTRRAIGYSTSMGLMMGALMAFVGSSEQIFDSEVYHLGVWFPIAFSVVAAVMSVASFINSKLVGRFGMRHLSHAAIIGFFLTGVVQTGFGLAYDGRPPLLVFCALVALNQALFALTVPNFNSMAMEPLGAIAGTASSFIGFYTTLLGAVFGMIVGQAVSGSVLPLSVGYMVLGGLAILSTLWAEKWRLFGGQITPH
ncbi:Bcr/CflA family drug resistance efflux transporter [Azorhizobium oxalatiphilum]|uniref:Bcr/CflA family drug resistance efflux transporter n=1 Tax=Azorhizobium oxalatiphilum TaxID=980631 RepID=A0A917BXL1_9HYPH|nr:multidrug effflux MFS transporter [Azorhizobium oxalatiphilum]GGF60496.1 Bcr/CflA family drug resistance efflux transporter [Azorhizobium oxalatiphilum]